MEFEYVCWRCNQTNALYGAPAGWWTEWYRVPAEWDCWCCDATNLTPDD